jgi:uncharacterized membrane protein
MSCGLQRRADGFFERGHQVTRLEAFVDAAFAFAVTLLAISIDQLPGNRDELILALKGVPAFLLSFLVIGLFWWDHNQWSRRYGLDDGLSNLLSLVFVGLILIYVYPLKLLFSSMCFWLSDGWLPSEFTLGSLEDLKLMFIVYGLAFASVGLVLLLLHWHALRCAAQLGLDPLERLLTRREILSGLFMPLSAAISLLLAIGLREDLPSWRYGLPGMVYFLLFGQFLAAHWRRADEHRLRAELASPAP